jgi:hypothetical protein
VNDFWNRAVQAHQPTEQLPAADGDAYRAWRRQFSGSRIYDELPPLPEQHAQAQPSIYVEREYSLDQYQREAPTSRWAKRDDESADAYIARTGTILRAIESLPEAEQALILQTREAILGAEPQSVQAAHDDVRKIIDQRQAANGVQGQGHKVSADQRFGTPSRVERLAGSAMPESLSGARLPSAVEIAAQLRKADEERMQFVPQRTDVSQLRSSGEGLIVTNQK